MPRIVIKCFPAPGFDGVFRAGRKWPAAGITVDTVADEEDAAPVDGIPQIGKKTMAALDADGRFSFGISGTIDEIEALRARCAALEAENAALKAAAGDGKAKGGKSKE